MRNEDETSCDEKEVSLETDEEEGVSELEATATLEEGPAVGVKDVALDRVEDGVLENANGFDAADEESSGDESEDENVTEGDDTDGVPSAVPLTIPDATIRGSSTGREGPTNCPMLPMTS